MSETTPVETGAEDAPRERWRPRALHWHLSIWSVVAITLFAAFLALASMSFTGRVVVLPDWFSERAEARINALLPSGQVSLRQVEFGVTPQGRPKLRLVGVGLRDETGLEIAQLNGIEGGFRIGPALLGRLELTVLRLQGAQGVLRRFTDGSFALSMGRADGTKGDLGALLDLLDAQFNAGLLRHTRRIEATDLTITLEDARSGRLWQVTDGRLEITPSDSFIDSVLRFDVFNMTENLASTEISFRSDRTTSEASLAVRFDNAAARDIAAQTPALAFLSVLDAPISGALRTTLDRTGAIADLAGTMEFGTGALSPTPGATPASFDGAKVYLDYDPDDQRINFQGASVRSDLGTVRGEGHVYMTDYRNGWPGSYIGQFTLKQAELNPEGMFEQPLTLDRGLFDIRVQLDPFVIDVGQAVIFRGENRHVGSGRLSALPEGWQIALDAEFDTADREEILALWPLNKSVATRAWFTDHALEVNASDGRLAWRMAPGDPLRMYGTVALSDAKVLIWRDFPPVEIETGYQTLGPEQITIVAERATVTAPDGNVMDVSGLTYRVSNLPIRNKVGVTDFRMKGPLRGALSLLDLPPFDIFKRSEHGPDVARGEISVAGVVSAPVPEYGEKVDPAQVRYDLDGVVTQMRSDRLIDGKLLKAERLALKATHEGIELSGPVRIGQAEATGAWHMPIVAAKSGEASIDGTFEINPASLREFGMDGIADMVSGAARSRYTMTLPSDGSPPVMEMTSDLAGLSMKIPGTGWSKSARAKGALSMTILLDESAPSVTALSINVAGLRATGRATTRANGGGLDVARFDRVRIGSWLDAPVVLTGQGPNRPLAISVPGGTVDMRYATVTSSNRSSSQSGLRAPLTAALDRLVVSEGITINNLKADLDISSGMSGTFTGFVRNGGPVNGTVAQTAKGVAVRIRSSDAGAVLRGAGVFETARGGDLEMILAPVGVKGVYEGEFTISRTRVVDASTMAELLSVISLVGLIDQLQGVEGIGFDEVQGRFRLSPDTLTLYHSAAVGASLGISMDGYYNLQSETIDMQGVVSPLYILNVLGRIVSARDGEGLVGFNFTLKGSAEEPEVSVNPLSILTPGVLREIFRRAPPTTPGE